MPEYEVLARNVKRIRKEMRLSQMEFAERCGVCHDTISLLERQKIDTKLTTIQNIAAYVGCRVVDLLSDDTEQTKSYREPMVVRECLMYVRSGNVFPVCPRCNITIEREYQSFCDRCGQRLNWKGYNKAIIRHL